MRESVDHLFVTCRDASMRWYFVCRWLGWEWVLPNSLLGLLQVFVSFGVDRQSMIDFTLI